MTAKPSAHLMLRQPLTYWKPGVVIDQTLDYCRRIGIGEVIWMIDAEAFNHGFTPLSFVERLMPSLIEAREKLAAANIISSINPWRTRGHYDGGHDRQPPRGFRWHVNPDGTESRGRACYISPGWRKWLIDIYTLYAKALPDKLWVEDDFRLFVRRPSEIGCFCDEHVEAFAQVTGQMLERDELVERMTRSGEPDALRARWLDFHGEQAVAICRQLQPAVHEHSPSTRLGLMNSHSDDGRWWADAVRALAGPHQPLARPSLGPYSDRDMTNYLPDRRIDHFKELACMGPDTQICPELEAWTFTPYHKSVKAGRLQLAFSQVIGHRDITMAFFDFVGTPQSDQPRVEAMLKSVKPILDALASVNPPVEPAASPDGACTGGRLRGVAIPFSPRHADAAHSEKTGSFDAFHYYGEGWAEPLQGSGMSVVYNGDERVAALTGQSARSMTDDEIRALLSGGVLLDGTAATALSDMGYDQQIGVTPGPHFDRNDIALSAERDDWNGEMPLADAWFMNLMHIGNASPQKLFHLEPRPDAKVVSTFVDPDHQTLMPGMVTFENQWGGRIATYPCDLSHGTSMTFMNWQRRRQLQKLVRWLGRDRIELAVHDGAWMIPVRRDYRDYTIIATFNLEHDDWDDYGITFTWPGDPASVQFEQLTSAGEFVTVRPQRIEQDNENVTADFAIGVGSLDFVVLRVSG